MFCRNAQARPAFASILRSPRLTESHDIVFDSPNASAETPSPVRLSKCLNRFAPSTIPRTAVPRTSRFAGALLLV